MTARWPGRVTELYLYNNGLTGSIPPALGNLGHLQELNLGNNALTGAIPRALGSLANLESLYLDGAGLSGRIPSALGSLVNLRLLHLTANALTGPIPAELGGLVNLEWLELEGNDLTGSIPGELGNLVNLERLSLSANALTGPIPGALGSLTNLRGLHLGQHALTVTPAELGSLVNLEVLNLRWNALTGPIPAALGSLVNLRSLNLTRNWGVSGPLPPGLQLSRLYSLHIDFTQACASADWRDWLASLLRNRDRLGFLYPKCHCEGRSAVGTQGLEDGGKPFVMPALPPGSWRREGHGASLPVMRASAPEEMRRISLTIRSSSRLFAIHSRYRTSSSSVSFKPTVFPRALRVQ